MAANLTEGAALGSVCNLLVAAVLEVTQKVAAFKFSLDRLKTTLNSIKPIYDDIERLNEILNRPEDETESFLTQLRKAEKLVRKCLEIKSWNFYKKYTYSRKLNALDQSLLRFFK